MKKQLMISAALALSFMLAGCSVPFGSELARNSDRPSETAQPALDPVAQGESKATVPLYFRFGSEPYLSSESRTITVSDSLSLEEGVLKALIGGPSASSLELKGLINPNTRVISVTEQGGCYFVTFSAEFLEPISGLPEGWREDATWTQLVQSTQQLAAYSVVNTLLSLGRAKSVQILIADSADASARRPTRNEMGFSSGEDGLQLMEPLSMDLSRVLTAEHTAELIMQAIHDKNWARVERFVAQSVPDRSQARPTRQQLIAELTELDVTLIDSTIHGSAVTADGQLCTVLLDFSIQRTGDSEAQTLAAVPLTFVWENNGWLMSYSALEMMIRGDAS